MTSRRNFLRTSAAGAVFGGSAYGASRSFAEVEASIARKDFRNLTKADLPTPSMILDEAIFEKNLRHMATSTKAMGINVRAHVKIHKSPEISKRQIALGAVGVCCATIAECELMVGAGVHGVLHTCQPAGVNKISRAAALSKRDSTFTCVVDDPISVDLLDEAAAAAKTRLNTMVDVYAGLTRQGCQGGEAALRIAQKIANAKNLRLAGLMGYSGTASHTRGFEARKKRSSDDLAALQQTRDLVRKSGLPVEIMTGGSTGTYNIDKANGLTELQAGSYIFMDTLYRRIGGKSDDAVYTDFGGALTVLSTVVSRTRPHEASIDCGNKALLRPTDEVKGRPGIKIENQGAEYGMLILKDADQDIKLGDRVEIYPSNLDMSTNVYDRYYVARGERIVDVWPIMGRTGAAQR